MSRNNSYSVSGMGIRYIISGFKHNNARILKKVHGKRIYSLGTKIIEMHAYKELSKVHKYVYYERKLHGLQQLLDQK